jgi:hypothetical protein
MPDNSSYLFRICGSAQSLKGQDSSSLFTKTRYQMKNRINETPGKVATECGEEHGVDASAIRLANAEGTRDRENHNQPEQNL